MKHEIKLSPMTRLYAAFDAELNLDKSGQLANLKGSYIERISVAEHKRDVAFRAVFIVDAVLAVLISGSSLKIPVLDVSTSSLPAMLEITTACSAILIALAAVAFINLACYESIVNQYGVRASRNDAIDPDFITASEKHTELALKVLRKKFNIWGIDFHDPGLGFSIFTLSVAVIGSILILLVPLLHFSLNGYSLYMTLEKHGVSLLFAMYASLVILANVLAVLVAIGPYVQFKFTFDDQTPTAS